MIKNKVTQHSTTCQTLCLSPTRSADAFLVLKYIYDINITCFSCYKNKKQPFTSFDPAPSTPNEEAPDVVIEIKIMSIMACLFRTVCALLWSTPRWERLSPAPFAKCVEVNGQKQIHKLFRLNCATNYTFRSANHEVVDVSPDVAVHPATRFTRQEI